MTTYFPIALKFALGLNQTWINIELCVIIRHSLEMIENSELDAPSFPHRFLKYGRIFLNSIILCFVIALGTIMLIKDMQTDSVERMQFGASSGKIFVYTMSAIDFAFLTSSISLLIYLLRKAAVTMEEQKQQFRQETLTLMTILIIFDLSFILRLITDIAMSSHHLEKLTVGLLVWLVFTGLIFDIIPVGLILLIHSRTFKTIKFTSLEETEDIDDIMINVVDEEPFNYFDEQSSRDLLTYDKTPDIQEEVRSPLVI